MGQKKWMGAGQVMYTAIYIYKLYTTTLFNYEIDEVFLNNGKIKNLCGLGLQSNGPVIYWLDQNCKHLGW